MQCIFNIISRAAAETAFCARNFINLSQRAFNKAGSGAYECHYPHPENRARTAYDNGNGDTCDIANAYAGSGTDTKSLERGNMVFLG